MKPRAPLIALALLATACSSMPDHHHVSPEADGRVVVEFPEPLRSHTLANMRDHLLAIQEIQQALATGTYDKASQLAESRLGMTSLKAHGAHDVSKFMPEGMQAIGTQMHRSASRLAVEASNTGATGDLKPALVALSTMTAQCVACHASYRMK